MSTSPPGLSLWLVPRRGSLVDRLLWTTITDLSAQVKTPKWPAHITLLGQIISAPASVEDILRQAIAATTRAPLRLSLPNIAIGDSFFQCVVAEVEQTTQLIDLNILARQLFVPGFDPSSAGTPRYWPHLSLVYGDLTTDVRRSVKAQIEAHADYGKIVGSVMDVDTIEIWNTEGPVESWSKVGEVSLLGATN